MKDYTKWEQELIEILSGKEYSEVSETEAEELLNGCRRREEGYPRRKSSLFFP